MNFDEFILSLIDDQMKQLNNIANLIKNQNKTSKSDAKKRANKQIIKMLKPNNHGRR